MIGFETHFPTTMLIGKIPLFLICTNVSCPHNKGGNVGSHAFSMWRVRAAFEYAYAALSGLLFLLSRVQATALKSAAPKILQYAGATI